MTDKKVKFDWDKDRVAQYLKTDVQVVEVLRECGFLSVDATRGPANPFMFNSMQVEDVAHMYHFDKLIPLIQDGCDVYWEKVKEKIGADAKDPNSDLYKQYKRGQALTPPPKVFITDTNSKK